MSDSDFTSDDDRFITTDWIRQLEQKEKEHTTEQVEDLEEAYRRAMDIVRR